MFVDEKINDDVSRFVALFGVHPQNLNVFYVENIFSRSVGKQKTYEPFFNNQKEKRAVSCSQRRNNVNLG